MTFPALELGHLLFDLLLVVDLTGSALVILIAVVSVKQSVISLGELFELVSIMIVFFNKPFVFVVESHILLVFPFDVFVILNAVFLHLFQTILVSLFF